MAKNRKNVMLTKFKFGDLYWHGVILHAVWQIMNTLSLDQAKMETLQVKSYVWGERRNTIYTWSGKKTLF